MNETLLAVILGGIIGFLISVLHGQWKNKNATAKIIDLTYKLTQQKNDEAALAKKADDAVKDYENAKTDYDASNKPSDDSNK